MSQPTLCFFWREKKFVCLLGMLLLAGITAPAMAQDISENANCLECHGEKDLTGEVRGKEVSVYIDSKIFGSSSHKELACVDCHEDIKELPHEDELKAVDCARCHDDIQEIFAKSVHGDAAFNRKDQYAPTCASCHGSHNVLPPSNATSTIYIMNIPATCGQCHKEGTEMTATHEIEQKNVIANYSMSIHGEGLFKRGLKVTAVCTSCHGAHNILPHQNPESKINRNNVAKTCETCHAQIEQVHEKIVEGRLWQQEPNKVPVCVECHQPHKVRRVFYEDLQISDQVCLTCHQDQNLKMEKEGKTISLYTNKEGLDHSAHADINCVKCHYDVHPDRTPVCKEMKPVDCSVCHAEMVNDYRKSSHGMMAAQGNPNAPTCQFCHGTHEVLPKKDQKSPSFPRNIPALCSRCHADGKPAALLVSDKDEHIIQNYTMSIHGKGLLEGGLMVTAVCTNCHTSHRELPASDPQSSVNPQKIGETCGVCHLGIYEQFRTSIHSFEANPTDKELPGCSDCHQAHSVKRVDTSDFRSMIIDQCGRCHMDLTKTYFDTYHGKVSKLGNMTAARCYDCHGSHNIYPVADSRSTLNRSHIVDTCKTCHPSSHRKFTGYLTHATHHDKDRYPALFYSFWFMTALLAGTLTFFGIHTFLWFIRSLIFHFRERDKEHKRTILQTQEVQYYRRFKLRHRITHFFVIVSFLSLALTGMTLKFPDVEFFGFLSQWLGGPEVLGNIHRLGAIITFGYFGTHLFFVFRMLKKRQITLKGLLSQEYTMLPRWRDWVELKQNFLWFFGKGERPAIGRWTYWEKFDYFAVFWGVAIIGATGLILWFPEKATLILPGWVINVATVIHSDEALLAAAFIFTIHFFNTHFRPGIFPMDPVIFTGRIPLEEFKEERPREYAMLVQEGKLNEYLVGPPSKAMAWTAVIAGFTFLTIGLALISAIVYGMLFAYL
ncbi:MAG: cytochrome c3 family protein [Candidatus Omnitrophota bacterium]